MCYATIDNGTVYMAVYAETQCTSSFTNSIHSKCFRGNLLVLFEVAIVRRKK